MEIRVEENRVKLGQVAAEAAAEALKQALAERGEANLILATGTSQFEMLEHLVTFEIDWRSITCFHLDEYLGISPDHPASFRKFLRERFYDRVAPVKSFHWIQADEGDPAEECARLAALIERHAIDVACIGIGENGHLAFNDPPADFETTAPYLVVDLDEACRRQQLGEGWFPTFDDVPRRAISMSVSQVLRSGFIVCTVPDSRKAQAVRATVEGPVCPEVPASILQRHPHCLLALDTASARLLVGTSTGAR